MTTPQPPRTQCTCGATTFSVAETLWHRAEIDNGQLVVIKVDDDCGGFDAVKCAKCSAPYPLVEFDADNLMKNV